MTWLDMLNESQIKRLEQIEVYGRNFGYADDSQEELLWQMYQMIKTVDFTDRIRRDHEPWWKKQIRKNGQNNPYTCRLLRRFDYLIYWLKGKNPYWSKRGRLCEKSWELSTHFPHWLYGKASDIQNHWYISRLILSI
jgi:hypothetical protein